YFSSRRRHTRFSRDWSSDVCSSDLRDATAATSLPGAVSMSSPSKAGDEEPITRLEQLVAVPASGEKPRADWRIGTEHEKFGFQRSEERREGKERRSRGEQRD